MFGTQKDLSPKRFVLSLRTVGWFVFCARSSAKDYTRANLGTAICILLLDLRKRKCWEEVKDVMEENHRIGKSERGELVFYSEFDREPLTFRQEKRDNYGLFQIFWKQLLQGYLDFLNSKKSSARGKPTRTQSSMVVPVAQISGRIMLYRGTFREKWSYSSNFSQFKVGSFEKVTDGLMHQLSAIKL